MRLRRRLANRAQLFTLALTLGSGFALGQDKGRWEGPYPFPLPGVHAVVLPPDGQVLLFSYPLVGPDYEDSDAWVLDPTTLGLTQYRISANIFCGGHGLRANGQALIVGGTKPGHGTMGAEEVFSFSLAKGFKQQESMADGRWYPTVVKLPNRRLIAFSGRDATGGLNRSVEIWKKSTGWLLLAGADRDLPLYPMAMVIHTGEVFVSGPHKESAAFKPSIGTWRFVATPADGHYAGCAVIVPKEPTKVMMIGGSGDGLPTHPRVEVIDLADASPAWAGLNSMNQSRQHHNAVLLPDATVLVLGGENQSGGAPVLRPEVYDPVANRWTLLVPQHYPRVYHSTAVLLADGRVLTSGGEGDGALTAEIFNPPYLFRGRRPSLSGVPGSVQYGASFDVTSDQAAQIADACLIAPSAVTHSYNQHQRYVEVGFHVSGCTVTIDAPTDSKLAPRGYYMLFLVNDQGVPSMGEFVRLRK